MCQKQWVLTTLLRFPEINDLDVSESLGKTPEILTRFPRYLPYTPKGSKRPSMNGAADCMQHALHENKGREGIGAAHAALSP